MLRRDLPIQLSGSAPRRWEASMPYFLCAVLLICSLIAEGESSIAQAANTGSGSFYVNGIVYQYVAATDYTVVAAAHSVINRKFVAVKVRVFNVGQQSVTVKPEEVIVEDAVAGQLLTMISAAELAKRMRRPYNWARLAVNPVTGEPADASASSDTMNPQFLEMMRAMAAKANGSGSQCCQEIRTSCTRTRREPCRREEQSRARQIAIRFAAFAIVKPPAPMSWRNSSGRTRPITWSRAHSWPTPSHRNPTRTAYFTSPCPNWRAMFPWQRIGKRPDWCG